MSSLSTKFHENYTNLLKIVKIKNKYKDVTKSVGQNNQYTYVIFNTIVS